MKKLTTTLLLAAAVATGVTPAAFAASDEATNAANALYKQGLFLGNGTNATGAPNFELDRKPTRHEAITMLVRLLGKEEEAKKGTWNTPFTDVDEWAKPYVGYAYANKLTTGTSETTFSGNDTVTASEYLTLVLRVLGYDDKKGDFSWDKAWELSDKIGLTKGQYNASTNNFTRGDVAIVSQATAEMKAETDKKPEDDKSSEDKNTSTDKNNNSSSSNNNNTDKDTSGEQKQPDSQKPDTSGNQSDSQETKTAKKISEARPTFYEKDGEYYESYDWSNEVVEYEVDGVTKQYITAGSISAILVTITGEAYFDEWKCANLYHNVTDRYFDEDTGKQTSCYGNGLKYAYTPNVEGASRWLDHEYNGNKVSVTALTNEPENKAYMQDGLQCVSDGRYNFVCLQDVLDRLGIEGTLTITEVPDVGTVWSFK